MNYQSRQQPHHPRNLMRALALLGACASLVLAAPAFAADPPGEQAANSANKAKATMADGSVRTGDGSTHMGDGSVRTLVPAVQTGPQGSNTAKGGGSDGALIGLLRPAGPEAGKPVKKMDTSKQKTGQQ